MGTLEGYVEGMINLSGGGGGGTSDYEELENKPSINGVTLSGNKTTSDLNVSYNNLLDKPYINNMPPSTGANIGDVLTHTSEGDNWVAPEKELPAISVTDDGKALTVSNGAAVWGNVEAKTDYSTEETEIGTWIDGSSVYQKTIIINGNYSGRTTIDISSYIETGTKLIACEGIAKYVGSYDNYYAINGDNIFIYPYENINTIKTNWGSSTLPVEIILTIKYIKTT